MAASDTENFVAHISKHGLAKSNRFNVVIPLPPELETALSSGQEEENESIFDNPVFESVIRILTGAGRGEVVRGLNTMCKVTAVPGKTLFSSDTNVNGIKFSPAYTDQYNDIRTTFVLSRDMLEKNVIDMWTNLIINPNTHDVSYFDSYVTNLSVKLVDDQDNPIHEVVLMDAYPIDVEELTADTSSQNENHELSVTWKYRKWVNVSSLDPDAGAGDVTDFSQTPIGIMLEPVLNNPVIQHTLRFIEETTGFSLEGEGVFVYNQINEIVESLTNQSINEVVTLLQNKKYDIFANNLITDFDKQTLTTYIDDIIDILQ